MGLETKHQPEVPEQTRPYDVVALCIRETESSQRGVSMPRSLDQILAGLAESHCLPGRGTDTIFTNW